MSGNRALIACALWTILLPGCSRRATAHTGVAPADASASDPPPSPSGNFVLPAYGQGVTVAPVTVQRLADYFDIAGRIEADPTRVVRVYAPVSGRLLAVRVQPADHVTRGQVLAILASSDVAGARSAYRQAQADAEVKHQALERVRLLYENHVNALRDLQQAQADAVIADAALASAAERLTLLGVDSGGASDEIAVRAPREGEVTDVGGAPGEYAKSLDNAAALCTIADLTTVWAVGDVFEKDLANVSVGDSATVVVDAYPGQPRRGRIAAIASTVDTTTRTLKVRVALANPRRLLKPDMFATIRISRPARPVVAVPEAAVVREGTAAYLFVQTAPGHFERRAVTLGRDADGRRIEVTSGLAPGDSIVVRGAELLRAAMSS